METGISITMVVINWFPAAVQNEMQTTGLAEEQKHDRYPFSPLIPDL